jgi:hypothetical protein
MFCLKFDFSLSKSSLHFTLCYTSSLRTIAKGGNNEIPTTQTSLHFWDKLLNVFLIPNKERCEGELEFIMNVICNEELNLLKKEN